MTTASRRASEKTSGLIDPKDSTITDMKDHIKEPWEGEYAAFNIIIFGEPGEGYFRIALTQKRDRLAEAVDRIKALGL